MVARRAGADGVDKKKCKLKVTHERRLRDFSKDYNCLAAPYPLSPPSNTMTTIYKVMVLPGMRT